MPQESWGAQSPQDASAEPESTEFALSDEPAAEEPAAEGLEASAEAVEPAGPEVDTAPASGEAAAEEAEPGSPPDAGPAGESDTI